MKKTNWLCIPAVLLLSLQAAAQFKPSAAAVRNFKNLEIAVLRKAAVKPAGKAVAIQVPAGVIAGNTTFLTPAALPPTVNKVTASLHYYYASLPKPKVRSNVEWKNYPVEEGWLISGGQPFYTEQGQLARDLNRFYNGSGIAVRNANRMVKLYTLPVEGILYKPEGYFTAVLLKSENHFVIYDPARKTGQLVENTESIRRFFSTPANSGSFEEVVSLGGEVFEMPVGEADFTQIDPSQTAVPQSTQTEGDFEEIDASLNPQTKYQLERIRFGKVRQTQGFNQPWEDRNLPTVFHSQDALGQAVEQFHPYSILRVKNNFTHQVSYVYEIPHTNLLYSPDGAEPRILDPEKEVILKNEKTGGQLVERASLENPLFFTFLP